jgi:hypothetical protein
MSVELFIPTQIFECSDRSDLTAVGERTLRICAHDWSKMCRRHHVIELKSRSRQSLGLIHDKYTVFSQLAAEPYGRMVVRLNL